MSTYAVFLNAPNQSAWDAIRAEWPGRHFILDDRLAFVAPEGISTTADIANAVGINPETGRQGIVLEHSVHTGFNRNDLWEWLGKATA